MRRVLMSFGVLVVTGVAAFLIWGRPLGGCVYLDVPPASGKILVVRPKGFYALGDPPLRRDGDVAVTLGRPASIGGGHSGGDGPSRCGTRSEWWVSEVADP